MELTQPQIATFHETLWQYYAAHGRNELPWRQPEADGSFDPYKILVSELMLQQTQVPRVIPKYQEFIGLFPDIHTLAAAELGDVLRAWQGLGYNRRAKFLWQTAQVVDKLKYFPNSHAELVKLPGIGPNTAGAILAYTYNHPVVFIETNIRTVYIHHFFADQVNVTDKAITELVTQTMPRTEGKRAARAAEFSSAPGAMRKNVVLTHRNFYWAIMDYGTKIKATIGNASKASKHYAKQSKFQGSQRQIRGQVIRLLSESPEALQSLQEEISDERLEGVLKELVAEQLIHKSGSTYSL